MLNGPTQEPLPLKTMMLFLKQSFDSLNKIQVPGEYAEAVVEIKQRLIQVNNSLAVIGIREEQASKEAEEAVRKALQGQIAEVKKPDLSLVNGTDGPHTDSH